MQPQKVTRFYRMGAYIQLLLWQQCTYGKEKLELATN